MQPMRFPGSLILIELALCLLLAHAAQAQDTRPEPEHLRAHAEQIRDDPAFSVLGRPIAAKRLVPELYARHGFTRDLDVARRARRPAARDPRQRSRRARSRGLPALDAGARARGGRGARRVARCADRLRPAADRCADPPPLPPDVRQGRPEELRSELELHAQASTSRTRRSSCRQSIDSGELYARIEREKPQYELYRRLKAELARQRELAAEGGWPPMPAGPTLKPGASDPRVRGAARAARGGRRSRRRASRSTRPGSTPRSRRR